VERHTIQDSVQCLRALKLGVVRRTQFSRGGGRSPDLKALFGGPERLVGGPGQDAPLPLSLQGTRKGESFGRVPVSPDRDGVLVPLTAADSVVSVGSYDPVSRVGSRSSYICAEVVLFISWPQPPRLEQVVTVQKVEETP